jgi:hypothetical protein
MKEGEPRKRNSPELEQRRWYGDELVVESPISPGDIRKRSGGGSEKGEDAERR